MVPELNFEEAEYLDTPRLVADDTQKTVWKWEQQEPFGVNAANEDPDADTVAFEFNLRFPGQYFDKETGLHYNYHRTFDPGLGRYTRSDPIGLLGGANTFAYALQSPLTVFDPLGLYCAFVNTYDPVCSPTEVTRRKVVDQYWDKEFDVVPDPKAFPRPGEPGGGFPFPGFDIRWRTVLVTIGQVERLYKCRATGVYRCWDDCTKKLVSETGGTREWEEWQFDRAFVDREYGPPKNTNTPDPGDLPPTLPPYRPKPRRP